MKTLESSGRAFHALGALVLTFALVSPILAVEDIWAAKSSMPTARFFLDTCAVEGKIYAIGGASAPHVSVAVVELYDPVTDSWTRLANIPVARAGLAAASVNGKVYAMGGDGASTTFEYDPEINTWTRKADMPTGRGFLTASVVGGKIYAIGGATDTSGPAFAAVEEYDPAADTWMPKTDLPERRFMHTAGVVDGKIYIIAGSWQSNTASAAVFAYDPTADTWERKTDAPTARSWLSPSAAVANGRIYVMGGDFGPPDPDVEEYDPATDTWMTRPDMPTPRGGLATTVVNETIYVMGGLTTLTSPTLSTVEAYTPNPLIVDFNGDGTVDTKDLLRLIASWGEDDPDMDIGPTVFGDGTVDAADLEVLMSCWDQQPADVTLLSHWALDESEGAVAVDSMGARHAEVIGDPLWQPDGGVVDGALQFSGATVLVADSVANLSQGGFSVFAWIKGGAAGQVIISEDDGANWLGIDSVLGTLMSGLQSGGRFSSTLYSEAYVTDGSWHRVGFTWDGYTKGLYVDDVLVAEDVDADLACGQGGLSIGCGSDATPDTFFTGLIDDVRIYNRAIKP